MRIEWPAFYLIGQFEASFDRRKYLFDRRFGASLMTYCVDQLNNFPIETENGVFWRVLACNLFNNQTVLLIAAQHSLWPKRAGYNCAKPIAYELVRFLHYARGGQNVNPACKSDLELNVDGIPSRYHRSERSNFYVREIARNEADCIERMNCGEAKKIRLRALMPKHGSSNIAQSSRTFLPFDSTVE